MRYEDIDGTLRRSLTRQLVFAMTVVAGLVGITGGVAAVAEISGAVIGSGKVIVEGHPKQVQHPDGGTVRDILVQEGETVSAGQVLFGLDPTVVEANLAIVTGQIETLLAQEARLQAELAGLSAIAFPEALTNSETPDAKMLMLGQSELMAARTRSREGRYAQLTAQIAQLDEKIAALVAQKGAAEEGLSLAGEELESMQVLSDKDLLSDSQLRATRRAWIEVRAEVAALDAQIVETREEIIGRELERTQIDEQFREEVLTELDAKRSELARLREEEVAARDRRNRLEIRAPISGYLHELHVHTRGQVLSPAETLVTVVPGDGTLIVETRLPPQDIDQVYPGQTARLHFVALDQRTTPQLGATVIDVSPDASTDEATGTTFYLGRLRIAAADLERLEDQKLRPGMPVEVFIETQSRTILSYLVRPVTDQIQHAMRES